MNRKPGGDTSDAATAGADPEWDAVLAHRADDPDGRCALIERFVAAGVAPRQVADVLADGGDALYAAARTGSTNWTEPFGGAAAVALLAAELSTLAAQLNSRASGIRSVAVDQLMDQFSAVTVAAALGVSRQKVYEIARAGLRPPYIEEVPWRRS